MKKIICVIIILLSSFTLLSCKKNEEHIKVLLPSGIPSVALGLMFDDNNYDFTVVDGASMLSSELVKEDYDIIIAPIILGAQLYTKNSNNYKLASVITTGNSYLVSRSADVLVSLKDLEGETIASYGENTAPDIVLKAALEANGVDLSKVDFVYENSVADVFSNRFMSNNRVKYILSAEPIISKMEDKAFKDDPLSKVDLQDSLKEIIDVIPQAGIFVLNSSIDYSSFLNKVNNNVKYLNENPEEYANKLINITSDNKTIFVNLTEKVISKSIPTSNIVYMQAKENKQIMDKYFNMVNKYNNKILQGKEIDENFYY